MPPPPVSSSASAAASPSAPEPWRVDKSPIAKPATRELAFRVLPLDGGQHALLIAEEPAADRTFVRTIDEAGNMSPIKTLPHRHVAAAFDAPIDRLVSSDGSSFYLEPLAQDGRVVRHELRADAVVALGRGRLAFIEEREEDAKSADDADDDDTQAKAKPIEKPRREAKAKKPRPALDTLSKAVAVRLWLHPVDPSDDSLGRAIDSELAFGRPMPGMGLVAAAGTGGGARLLWYQPAIPARRDGRWIPRAQLMTGEVDASGVLRQGSSASLFSGDKLFGVIEGHSHPRLFARGDAALYVGRAEQTAGKRVTSSWEARLLHRSLAASAADAVFVADPARLLEPKGIAAAEEAELARIAAASPQLAEPQSADDAGRVAWAGARGYFVSHGRLFGFDRSAAAASEMAHPFAAERAPLNWGFVAASGAGIACTAEGLVEMGDDGALERHPGAVSAALAERPASVARIAGAWWGIVAAPVSTSRAGGATVVRLLDSRESVGLSPFAFRGYAALAGGSEHGLLLALRGERLAVWRLEPDGSASPMAAHRSPFRGGFSVVERASGGAIALGIEPFPGNSAIAVAFTADGAIARVAKVPVDLAAGRVGLAALPGGGAIGWGEPDSRASTAPKAVVWLDDDAGARASASYPASDASASCSDGIAILRDFPAREPGKFSGVADARGCAAERPAWTADGLRWFGAAIAGTDSIAERVIVRSDPPAVPLAGKPHGAEASESPAPAGARSPEPVASSPCPADMVSVNGALCVDRFESQLVDSAGVVLSPNYSTTPHVVKLVLDEWSFGRLLTGDLHARSMPLPPLLRARDVDPKPVATSRPGVVPSGYLSGITAEAACQAAGKRLCTLGEWTRACRGEDDRDFPYGDSYQQGACNVYRFAHPAAALHGNAAVGHLDPRLNLVKDGGEPMLRAAGATERCVSRWGADGIYDMVGNLDEWIDKKGGAFAGGFYSRSVRKGCSAVISVHPRRYFDYSLGTRCCLTP